LIEGVEVEVEAEVEAEYVGVGKKNYEEPGPRRSAGNFLLSKEMEEDPPVSVLCNQILDSMALLGGSSVQYCVAVRVQTYPL